MIEGSLVSYNYFSFPFEARLITIVSLVLLSNQLTYEQKYINGLVEAQRAREVRLNKVERCWRDLDAFRNNLGTR